MLAVTSAWNTEETGDIHINIAAKVWKIFLKTFFLDLNLCCDEKDWQIPENIKWQKFHKHLEHERERERERETQSYFGKLLS